MAHSCSSSMCKSERHHSRPCHATRCLHRSSCGLRFRLGLGVVGVDHGSTLALTLRGLRASSVPQVLCWLTRCHALTYFFAFELPSPRVSGCITKVHLVVDKTVSNPGIGPLGRSVFSCMRPGAIHSDISCGCVAHEFVQHVPPVRAAALRESVPRDLLTG